MFQRLEEINTKLLPGLVEETEDASVHDIEEGGLERDCNSYFFFFSLTEQLNTVWAGEH